MILLKALGIFALLPLAAPAILVCMIVVGGLLYWLAPVLWIVVATFVLIKAAKWIGRITGNEHNLYHRIGRGDDQSTSDRRR